MNNEVFIKGRRVNPDPTQAKGKGGEADIYLLGDFYKDGRKIALKLYKTPDHPDYALFLHEQKGAAERIRIHQTKLRAFPRNLPQRVVTPIDLATDRSGSQVRGFTLEFLDRHELLMRYAEKSFRLAGVGNEEVVQIFKDIHTTVSALHQMHVVLGDFNDMGVMVRKAVARIIDADSMQFGKFLCSTFTAKFVDPLICIPNTDPMFPGPMMTHPHNEMSDWYAYAVMLMQCLLFLDAGPYGGVYKPKNKAKRISHSDRWTRRITVFDPEVVYPKPAMPMTILPDDLLHYFHQMFAKDVRQEFPVKLLDAKWTECACGVVHARKTCPACQTKVIQPVEVTRILGAIKVSNVFRTKGRILYATAQCGQLLFLYHDNGYCRETGKLIDGPLDPQMRFRIRGPETMLGKPSQLVTLYPGGKHQTDMVDNFGNLPIFDANENNRFWLQGGRLMRSADPTGLLDQPDVIGDVLTDQSLFWVGLKFGFGFYRAGGLSVAFVFAAARKGINDSVKVPIHGTLIDSTCYFTDKLCWFFLSTKIGSKIQNTCHIIHPDGTVVTSVSAQKGDLMWLDDLRGKCVNGNSLFVPTDEGLKRYELKDTAVELTTEYPDTETILNSGDYLFLGKSGLYVVGQHEINILTMK